MHRTAPESSPVAAPSASARFVAACVRDDGGAWVEHRGFSMWPVLRPGDRLRVARLDGPPAAGEVAVFARAGRLVAHRVVAVAGETVTTRGDALRRPDAPIAREALVGRVTHRRRAGRTTPLGAGSVADRAVALAGRIYGMVSKMFDWRAG
jgi:hypothetical protein